MSTDLAGKKILVTGADGFIGSHLTEFLTRSGADVRAFVLYNSFNSHGWLDSLSPDVKNSLKDIFVGDVRDPNGVRNAVKGCDIVLHLAALIAIPYSYHSPDTYISTNINGTLNILQAARDYDVSCVVHTSTSEVYGTAQFVPMAETHPLQAQSPYAASKTGADQLALSFYKSFGTPVKVLRPFNTYGPRQSARAIIPTIITQIHAGKKNIRLGNISPTRDLTFVEDTVRGFVQIAQCDSAIGEVVNLGSGFDISIGDLAHLIAKTMGTTIEIQTDVQRVRPEKSEVERLFADTTKAQKLFGWNPAHGGLDGFASGLKKTIDWFTTTENAKLYRHDVYNI